MDEELLVFEEFRKFKANGLDAEGAYLKSKSTGQHLKILTNVYRLSLEEAKRLIIKVDQKGMTLEEYQERVILPALKRVSESEPE